MPYGHKSESIRQMKASDSLRPSASQDKLYKLENFGVATVARVTSDVPEC